MGLFNALKRRCVHFNGKQILVLNTKLAISLAIHNSIKHLIAEIHDTDQNTQPCNKKVWNALKNAVTTCDGCLLKENKTDIDRRIGINEGEKKESTNWYKDKSNSQEPQGAQGHQGLQEGQQFPVMDYK